jgi:CDP-diacylglycerol---serine O-phosphatidyltransferase
MTMNNNESPRGRGIYLIPNLFTLTALFAGFYAIVAAMKGNFELAGIAIFTAMVMDTLDGRVARMTHTQTEFGAQLDSLSDMVSFGIAPALITYTWGLSTLGKAGWLVAFVYVAAVTLRLARFNIQSIVVDKRFFKGLPCPAGASLLVSAIWSLQEFELNNGITIGIIAVVTVLVSLLMVSRIAYYSFKDIDLKNKVPFVAILVVVLFFVLISSNPPVVWLSLSTLFVVSGPALWLWKKYQRRKRVERRG